MASDHSNRLHWWETYKSGWHREGGEVGRIADYGSTSIDFVYDFANNPTVTLGTIYNHDDGTWNSAYMISDLTNQSMTIFSRGSKDGGRYVCWVAEGKKL